MQELDAMLKEFSAEAATTKKVLEQVPEERLAWRPHQRSMSLGQLALHIANVPKAIANITKPDVFDASQASFAAPEPQTLAEIQPLSRRFAMWNKLSAAPVPLLPRPTGI